MRPSEIVRTKRPESHCLRANFTPRFMKPRALVNLRINAMLGLMLRANPRRNNREDESLSPLLGKAPQVLTTIRRRDEGY